MISVLRTTITQIEVEINLMGTDPRDALRNAGRTLITGRVVGADGSIGYFHIGLSAPDGEAPRVILQAQNPESEVTRSVHLLPWPPETGDPR